MIELAYFVVVLLTVLTTSTTGTLALVRGYQQQHISRRWAITGMVTLTTCLPLLVPMAMAVLVFQILRYFHLSPAAMEQHLLWLILTMLGAILAAFLLTAVAVVQGIRRMSK